VATVTGGGRVARPRPRPSWPALLGGACLALAAAPAAAEIYRSTGPAGEPVYSDTPTPGAKPVEVAPASVYEAPPVTVPSPATHAVSPAPFSTLRIAAPANDAVHWKAEGPLRVTLETEPPLAPEHVAVLHVDGTPLARAAGGAALVLPLTSVQPGTHALVVEVVDAQGHALGRTDAVQVHIRQHNLNLPARRPPPKPGSGGGS
jgi:hypothetical protein